MIGLDFEVDASNIDEKINNSLKPAKLVGNLSLKKAKNIAKKYKNAIIIGADTLVLNKGEIIGKPKDKDDAIRILSDLSKGKCSVFTGFTIIDTLSDKKTTKVVKSTVFFQKLTKKQIKAYVNTGEPMDKAGAFAVFGKAAIFVKKTQGDFYNIIGLPIFALVNELKKFKVNILGRD